MKRSSTAMVAIATAGLAGIAQAQTTTPTPGQPAQSYQQPAPSHQGTAPPAQYNQYQSTATPSYQAPATAAPSTSYQAGMQQPTTMQQPAGTQPWGGVAASSSGLTRNDLMLAQEQLQAQGLYRGPIDGIMGSGTRRALAQFQRRNGLPPSGTLDQQTLASLSSGGIPSANSPSSGTANPPTGNAPVGTTAPLGAGTGAYNNQYFNNRQNTTAQPYGYSQPATR